MGEATRLREPARSAPLLITKLHPPPRREQTVARDRLLELLRPRPGVKLTVVAAPAGCGKTTLLGMWYEVEAAERPVAWVTLDEGDNDPVVLWSHTLEALRRTCPGIDSSVPTLVGAPHLVDVALRQLVNELAEQGDVTLILDDFHRLSTGAARDSIAWLIDRAPSTFHVVLASRSEPALPLGAMRAHGELLEVRADELGFTSPEADALLNGRLDLGLAPEDVDRLVERIEGWPAGVYLAGLSLAGVEDRHAFVSTFGGTSRHVVDFLVDEVLEAHDPLLQSLMLRSSVLERMCGPLCDAVLEREDSADLLSELARTNLFLLPLDDEGEWYRFHQLFAQLLRVELEHREPGLATTLHRRAYAWYREHGPVGEAIRYAQKAGAFVEATEAIVESWLTIASVGRHATVLAWLDGFPPELSLRDPRLLLIRAWMCSWAGRREQATAAIAALEDIGWPDRLPLPDGSTSFQASLATLQAGFPWGDVGTAYGNAVRATELGSRDSTLWADAAWALAMACYYRGDLDGADRWFDETVDVGRPSERWLVTASGLAYRSLIAGERGQIDEQQLLAEAAAEVARERGLEEVRGEVHVATGVSLEAQGRLEVALPYLERGVAVLRSGGQPLDLALALIRQAAVLQSMGRREHAAAAIAEARATVDSCRDPGILAEQLETLERLPRPRRREPALSEREVMVLRMLSGPLSERDMGRELYLSHNTIHSHTRSIYRKLGVSSRKQAVQRALELGILQAGRGEAGPPR
jgi:LuxR family transcriptional regulator, maltose regulon positive regulatory protein